MALSKKGKYVVLTTRFNLDKPEDASIVEALEHLIGLAETSVPKGSDTIRPVLAELIESYEGKESSSQIGNPIELARRNLEAQMLSMQTFMEHNFNSLHNAIEGIEAVGIVGDAHSVPNRSVKGSPIPADLLSSLIDDHDDTEGNRS